MHGIAEHSGRYETVGAWLAAQGAAVYSYDQRGHGKTAGPRAHVDSFNELVDDLEAFIQRVQQAHPDLPTTLIGVSMGGLVITTLLETRNVPVVSAVLVGAALQVGPGFSGMRIAMGKLLRRIFPRLMIALGNDTNDISSDPEDVRRFDQDPLGANQYHHLLGRRSDCGHGGHWETGPMHPHSASTATWRRRSLLPGQWKSSLF